MPEEIKQAPVVTAVSVDALRLIIQEIRDYYTDPDEYPFASAMFADMVISQFEHGLEKYGVDIRTINETNRRRLRDYESKHMSKIGDDRAAVESLKQS